MNGDGAGAVVNATIIRPNREPEKGSLLFRGGVIVKVLPERFPRLPPGTKKIDARLGYVSPGLIDLHLHGGGGRHFENEDAKALRSILRTHARYGTTSILPTMTASSPADILDCIAFFRGARRQPLFQSRILGLNLEGPFLSVGKRGAQPLRFIRPPQLKEVERILEQAEGLVKIMTIAPELDGSFRIIRALAKAGIIPAVGHTDADYDTTVRAIRAGVRYATHLFNSYPPLHHRRPGPVGAILESAEVNLEVLSDGIHLSPVILRLIFRLVPPARVIVVTDGNAALGARIRRFVMGGREVRVAGAEARLDDGTLVGSVVPMNQAIRNLMDFVGFSFSRALAHATLYPARILGLEERKGDLKAGMDADLVIWDKNLRPRLTLAGGKVVYEK